MNMKDYISIGEASKLLGIGIASLRNWEKAGKIKPIRHPLNNRRLYKKEDLEAMLNKIMVGNNEL